MIVAALVMGVQSTGKQSMSDAEIISRAKSLGMVESQTLNKLNSEEASVSQGESDSSKEKKDTSVTKEPAGTVKTEPAAKTDTSVSNEEPTPSLDVSSQEELFLEEHKPEEVIVPEKINPLKEDQPGYVLDGETVEISVVRGDSSVTVARRMYEAGLVESAVEFDTFLCQNGYDKTISVGTYEIPYGLTFPQMAEIIGKQRE